MKSCSRTVCCCKSCKMKQRKNHFLHRKTLKKEGKAEERNKAGKKPDRTEMKDKIEIKTKKPTGKVVNRQVPHKKTNAKLSPVPFKKELFCDVDATLLESTLEDDVQNRQLLLKDAYAGPTQEVAIDCEFVGVGYQGEENALARVSVVNFNGHVLLDSFVLPQEEVTDFRTQFSGVRPNDLKLGGKAKSFDEVHKLVAELVKGRVLVGHAIKNDLKVLFLSHPRKDIRDTSKYRAFRSIVNGGIPSLRVLAEKVLHQPIQTGEHDSVEDARAAMALYRTQRTLWEAKRANFHMKKWNHTKRQNAAPVLPVTGAAGPAKPTKHQRFVMKRKRFRQRIKMQRNVIH